MLMVFLFFLCRRMFQQSLLRLRSARSNCIKKHHQSAWTIGARNFGLFPVLREVALRAGGGLHEQIQMPHRRPKQESPCRVPQKVRPFLNGMANRQHDLETGGEDLQRVGAVAGQSHRADRHPTRPVCENVTRPRIAAMGWFLL